MSAVLLPDWWEEECWEDPDLLPELELRVARFLEMPTSAVANPGVSLHAGAYAGAHLRRVRDIDRDRLAPAIHASLAIARAVVRNLASNVPSPSPPPADGLSWRQQIQRSDDRVTLADLLRDLWTRGIPVVPIDVIPAPSFQGLAAIVEDRPVIVVGHKHDEPGRVAFLLAHEAGHIAAGDCSADAPVVDQDEEIASDDETEFAADRFATEVLVGSDEIPRISDEGIGDFKDLAKEAVEIERRTGADAGAIVFAWARDTGNYPMATMATKALYRTTGARRTLREYVERFIAIEDASQSDRELLRAVLSEEHAQRAPAG